MFYTFNQNNSGGSFVENEEVGMYVIVEAKDAKEANYLAERIGIYFNGCEDGTDCSCCGDRWYESNDYDGEETADIYGETPKQKAMDNFTAMFNNAKYPAVHVYYKNGKHEMYYSNGEVK